MEATVKYDAVFTKAQALNDESQYREAIAQLETIPVGEELYPRAQALLAQIHWVLSEDDAAELHATNTTSAPPAPRMATTIIDRLAENAYVDPTGTESLTSSGYTFTHASYYVAKRGNFGDLILPWSVRRMVERQHPVADWQAQHVHRLVDDAAVERINATDGLFIGGGGLFLPDTMPNANSGWQWNIANDMLDKITAPIAVTAVGLNLFRGQEFVGDTFSKSLTKLVEKSTIFGLRNTGSVNRVRDMLPAELAEKVQFLPCPTTLNGLLMPAFDGRGKTREKQVVHLNAAFDRPERRFGTDYGSFLAQIAHFIKGLPEHVEVRCAAHLRFDEIIAKDLKDQHDITIEVDTLQNMTAQEGLELYAGSSLVIGMRGHAGMIPFGVGTPIISLVSHPKLQYFLDDIKHPDWGISVHDDDLGAKLLELTLDVLANEERYRTDVLEARDVLNGVTTSVMAQLTPALPTSPERDLARVNLEPGDGPTVAFVTAFDNAINWSAPVALETVARGGKARFFIPIDERHALSDKQLERIDSFPISKLTLAEIAEEVAATCDVVVPILPGNVAFDLVELLRGNADPSEAGPGTKHPVIAAGFFGVLANNVHLGYQVRLGFDVLALNSEGDRALYADLAESLELSPDNMLVSGLTLLPGSAEPQKTGPIKRLLFADQPSVPDNSHERRFLYHSLIAYANAHPDREVVIKPRTRPGEGTFHKRESSPEEVLATLELPSNFSIDYTPISVQLGYTDLLLTISSTAAVEALGQGCRVAIVSDLGVTQDLMNPMFASSGLLRSFAQISADDIGTPREEWVSEFFPGEATVSPAEAVLDRVQELLASGERPGIALLQSPFGKAYRAARKAVEQERVIKREAAWARKLAWREAQREKEERKAAAAKPTPKTASVPRRLVRRIRRELGARKRAADARKNGSGK